MSENIQKNEKKGENFTYVNINLRETSVKKILNMLFRIGRPVTLVEIEEDTGISNMRIRGLLCYLSKMNNITKKYDIGPAKRGHPPRKMLWVSLNESQKENARRVISKYERLKKLLGGKDGF